MPERKDITQSHRIIHKHFVSDLSTLLTLCLRYLVHIINILCPLPCSRFRRPKRRTKELNYPSRPPRYKMDGSGRDGFVFLHGDVGKPKARIFRTNTTPWGAKSTAPWAHDPRLTIVAKCASLRRRPNTRGTKLVTPRQQRPYSAVRATSIFFVEYRSMSEGKVVS